MMYLLFKSKIYKTASLRARITSVAKRFDQYCPVAHAIHLVGERWTLLVVRELLHGPKRYTDLHDGLPGIGTNILAARLRELEAHGIVEQAEAAGAGGVHRLRADGVRRRAGGGRLRARPLGRPHARPSRPRRRALPRVGRQRLLGALLTGGSARA